MPPSPLTIRLTYTALISIPILLLTPLLGACLIWFLVGRRDRKALRRRFPQARGLWRCGWIGVLPYLVFCLAATVGRCAGTCVVGMDNVERALASTKPARARPPALIQRQVVVLTQAASRAASNLLANRRATYLRIAATPGQTGTLVYAVDATNAPDPARDYFMETNGIPILVDFDSADYLTGVTVDYTEQTHPPKFRFYRPRPDQESSDPRTSDTQ